jgi:L-seryl-tRNA(Ser) seleniumtransferase
MHAYPSDASVPPAVTRPPSVDRLLHEPLIEACVAAWGHTLTVDTIRRHLDELRRNGSAFDLPRFASGVRSAIESMLAPSQRPVFNLTGTVLHTNLGRAVMPQEAIDAVIAVMRTASNLEFELGPGARGDRDRHVERWLVQLTGAEAATVVNNNAAAVFLVLNTLARNRECIVSRGELVEIGGAFRVPDIMARAGGRLVEVGTTNRTHPADYESAIGAKTGALMKVHTSNYAVQGFTAEVPEKEVARIAHAKGQPFIVDLGSGMLVDLAQWGLPHEPTPQESIANGADVVTFSGDKLLGGPQAGLIVGSKALIAKIKKNPLKRSLRCDKMTLAALEAVLRLYATPERLRQRLPTLRWLTRPATDIAAMAARVQPALASALAGVARVEVTASMSQIGSGSLPVDRLPSAALAITPLVSGGRPGEKARRPGARLDALARAFRLLPVPVIGRIHEDRLLFDLRCLDDPQPFIDQLSGLTLP